MPPHASQIFEHSRLATLICSHSRLSDCARLCRVNHTIFSTAAPIVWEHVVGIHILLNLLPGAYSTSSKSTKSKRTPPNDTTLRTNRFNLYAPFVKRFEICSKSGDHTKTPNWNGLFTLSDQQTLLPNLVSLMATPCSSTCA
ncbi:hypothetical protein FRC12_009265 [Ceratobasidium sp. 428]|nr:hypothetical protein FRC12_009265 [Ceratobasidium sp. 428]